MFLKVMGVGVPALMGSLYMTGNLGAIGGTNFDRPTTEVYESLSTMAIPKGLKSQIQGDGAQLQVDRKPQEQVRWRWTKGGHELVSVTADISPLSGGRATNVRTTVTFAEKKDSGKMEVDMNNLTMMRGLADAAMSEQIASTIEQRPFDDKKVGDQMAAFILTHQGEMQKDMAKMMEMVDAEMTSFGTGGGSSMSGAGGASFQPGKPMVDVRRGSAARDY